MDSQFFGGGRQGAGGKSNNAGQPAQTRHLGVVSWLSIAIQNQDSLPFWNGQGMD
jgi:hypothetical protein